MPDFASSKTQRAAGKHLCRASRPAYTPARLAAWTAPKNYVLPFSQPCRQYSHIKHSAATSKLPSGSSRPTHPAACLSVPAPQSPASPQLPLRQHIPVLSLVLSTPLPFHATKKRNRLRRFPSLFLFFLQLQPKHLFRNLFHCSSCRPVSILFRTGHTVVVHKRHQVTRIFDFRLNFCNFLFFFFF